jgi:hypothetical protein
MTGPTPASEPGKLPSRRSVEELSPEAWLLRVQQDQPDPVEEKDFRYLASIAPASVLQSCTERYLPMIYSKVLFPGKGRGSERPPRATGDAEVAAFVDALWFRYRTMTGKQARDDVGALASVFSVVKPRQLVEDAMTREQFAERWAAAKA